MSGTVDGLVALAPNVFLAGVAMIFNQGSTFASNVWIANLLGKSVFGEYVIVLSTVQAAASLVGLGLGYTTTRYLSEWRHRDAARAGALLGLFSRLSWIAAIVAAIVLAATSSRIAGAVLRAPVLGPSLLLAAAATVFTVRNGFLTGALNGLESFRYLAASGVCSGIAYLALTVSGAVIDGVHGAAIGLFLSAVLQCALLTFALHRERLRQKFSRNVARFSAERPLLWRFAVPAALSGFTALPVMWAMQAYLARNANGFANLAAFAASLNLLTIAMFVPTVLNGVAMSWINRTQTLHGDAAYQHAMRTNIRLSFFTVSVSVCATALAGPVLLGLYGRDFRGGSVMLAVLLVAALPETLANALSQTLQTRERMWDALFGINIPRETVTLIVALFCIPAYGALGAAIAYLAGRVIALGSMFLLVRRDAGSPSMSVSRKMVHTK